MNTPIKFELAKLLKEKGFDEGTEANWWILAKDHTENYKKKLPVDESKIFFTNNLDEFELKTQIDEETEHNAYHVLSAPTIAQVIMWLYEKYEIWVVVLPELLNGETVRFYPSIFEQGVGEDIEEYSNSPTEAYEAAIEYTLNKLIL